MIILSNTAEQTVQPGQPITFNEVILHTGCGEYHRQNTSLVKMRAVGIYEIHFNANVGSATAATPVSLVVEVDAAPLPETAMSNTPAAVTDRNSVSASTAVKNCQCDNGSVTVINTGTTPITIAANPALFIHRIA